MPEINGRARLPGAPDPLARVLRAIGERLVRVSRAWAVVPLVAWAFVIWTLSSLQPPTIGAYNPFGSFFSNFAHAIEYGVLALLLALVVPRRDGWPDLAPRTQLALLAIAVAYALSDEIHQSFTPDRQPSVFDLLTDALGAWLTLRVIASVAGPYAAPERLRALFAGGLIACLASAALASWAPEVLPDVGWL